MGHDSDGKTSLLPYSLDQNPAPVEETGQDWMRKKQALVNDIMETFHSLLPSNYVALTNGPWYTLQFQAIAEQLAEIQIAAQEVFKDSDFDFTRSEFLWGVIGTLAFPAATERKGAPSIDGDIEYRAFLHKIILLLLQGATPATVEEGAECLTTSDMILVEKFLTSVQRDPTGAWTLDNQFEMELFVEGLPTDTDPATLIDNLDLVLEALKPAHTLFQFSFLFREVWGDLFTDTVSWEMSQYHYDDFRKNCYGAKAITGTGDTLSDRTLFSDPDLSFASIPVRAVLTITSGANAGRYDVVDVLAFPVGTDVTARAYTTSPTGLTGSATVEDDVITDSSQDWASAVEGEVLTFAAGPNAGSYRLSIVLGPGGGDLAAPTPPVGPATEVRVAPSTLRVSRRMPSASVTAQPYTVTVDRLGVREPKTTTNEDVSEQFYL